MQRTDVGGRIKISIEAGLPEHDEECVHLEWDSNDKEVVGEDGPVIHTESDAEKGECESKVNWWL